MVSLNPQPHKDSGEYLMETGGGAGGAGQSSRQRCWW